MKKKSTTTASPARNTEFGTRWRNAGSSASAKIPPMLAAARLYQKIGDDARKSRFEPRPSPQMRRSIKEGCYYAD